MNVVVLGCGPAGLMAAHGATSMGAHVTIFSKRRKSEMYGAQYLHAPIPGVPLHGSEPVQIQYLLKGSISGYRHKVYGDSWSRSVSPEDLSESHEAWDIRSAYDWLWEEYKDGIKDEEMTPGLVRMLVEHNDLVISSIPRPALCAAGHSFGATEIIAAGDAPERGITLPYNNCPPNTVLCNGTDDVSWYRLSNIYGLRTVEWSLVDRPMDWRPPVNSASRVLKPTETNCTCNPGVVHVGRYGRWEKGVLSHTAYKVARDAVALMQIASNR